MSYIITLQVNALPGQAIGIKEHLAIHCERYGDVRVISVQETSARPMEQMTIGGRPNTA